RMDRVSVHQLQEMITGGTARTILDVRSPISQAASGRIPGARTINMQFIAQGIEGVPVEDEAVVYCACPNEASAVKVAKQLKELGFKRVRPLHGGIDAWIEAGFEVERDSDVHVIVEPEPAACSRP